MFWSMLHYAGTALTFFPCGLTILGGPGELDTVTLVGGQALAHMYWIPAVYLAIQALTML